MILKTISLPSSVNKFYFFEVSFKLNILLKSNHLNHMRDLNTLHTKIATELKVLKTYQLMNSKFKYD